MRFLVGNKVFLMLAFVILMAVGTFLVKSPVDNLPVFTWEQFLYGIGLIGGITLVAKGWQAAKQKNKVPPMYISIAEKLWSIIDPTKGIIFAVLSFILATALVYYRVAAVPFELWLGYHAIFLTYFDIVNVAKK